MKIPQVPRLLKKACIVGLHLAGKSASEICKYPVIQSCSLDGVKRYINEYSKFEDLYNFSDSKQYISRRSLPRSSHTSRRQSERHGRLLDGNQRDDSPILEQRRGIDDRVPTVLLERLKLPSLKALRMKQPSINLKRLTVKQPSINLKRLTVKQPSINLKRLTVNSISQVKIRQPQISLRRLTIATVNQSKIRQPTISLERIKMKSGKFITRQRKVRFRKSTTVFEY